MSSLKKWAKSVIKHPEKLLNPLEYTPFGGMGEAIMDDVTGKLADLKGELDGSNAQRRAAELQNEYNLKYWQMQNEYNTPSAQMQRYIDAGLNPNLAYSLSNTAGDVGRVNVGVADSGLGVASKVISAISAWQGVKNMRLQNDNLAYQTEFTKEQARRMKIDNNWLEHHNTSSFAPQWQKGFYSVFADVLSLLSGDMSFFDNIVESQNHVRTRSER